MKKYIITKMDEAVMDASMQGLVTPRIMLSRESAYKYEQALENAGFARKKGHPLLFQGRIVLVDPSRDGEHIGTVVEMDRKIMDARIAPTV